MSADPRLTALLDNVTGPLPEEQGIRAGVKSRLEKLWSSPREKALAEVLGTPVVTIEEARDIAFFPNEQHAAKYASLILDPHGDVAPDDPKVTTPIVGRRLHLPPRGLPNVTHRLHPPSCSLSSAPSKSSS